MPMQATGTILPIFHADSVNMAGGRGGWAARCKKQGHFGKRCDLKKAYIFSSAVGDQGGNSSDSTRGRASIPTYTSEDADDLLFLALS